MADSFAVIVVVDGLRADAVGSYGNAQADTPFLDRLSAESILYDFTFCLNPSLEGFYLSASRGVHPCRHATLDAGPPRDHAWPLFEAASHYFLTDSPMTARTGVAPFDWTQIAASEGYFPAAARRLSERFHAPDRRPQIGWVHVSLADCGAPIESRQQYDGLVTAVDDGIRTLFTELSFPDEASGILFAVVGCRGYALGEHGCVGNVEPLLHEELLHVPLIVYSHEPRQTPLRVGRLTSPLAVHALLRAWLAEPESGGRPEGGAYSHASMLSEAEMPADCLFFLNSLGHQAIRTPGWYLIRRPPLESEQLNGADPSVTTALYLKPDDRWEVNEVSSRRPEIVEALNARLDVLVGHASAGGPLDLPPLPAELLKGS